MSRKRISILAALLVIGVIAVVVWGRLKPFDGNNKRSAAAGSDLFGHLFPCCHINAVDGKNQVPLLQSPFFRRGAFLNAAHNGLQGVGPVNLEKTEKDNDCQ